MKGNSTTLRTSLTAIALCGLVTFAAAQGPQRSGREGGRPQGPRVSAVMVPLDAMKEDLALSSDQSSRISAIVQDFRSKMRQGGPGGPGGPPPEGENGGLPPGDDNGGPGGPPPHGGFGGGQQGPGGPGGQRMKEAEAASRKIEALLSDGQKQSLQKLEKTYDNMMHAGIGPRAWDKLKLTKDQRMQIAALKPSQRPGQPPQGGQEGGQGGPPPGDQGGFGGGPGGQGGPGRPPMMDEKLRDQIMQILTDRQKDIADSESGPGGPGGFGGGPGGPPPGGGGFGGGGGMEDNGADPFGPPPGMDGGDN